MLDVLTIDGRLPSKMVFNVVSLCARSNVDRASIALGVDQPTIVWKWS